MEKRTGQQQQEKQQGPDASSQQQGKYEGLPVETSPYTQYSDLEDYKQQGYGAQGHQEPKTGRGAAGSTDAPTHTRADPKAS
uniref:Uncharacterized protein n=1 Tax=Kalanchoe fedtschenkoi TaxID=63787 RepID=A0A7N1A1B8_KALFE